MKRPMSKSDKPVAMAASVDRQSRFPLRRAFTLMETLAALAILGLVVSSLSASLHLYWKYRSLSRSQITIAQLQRGIIEMHQLEQYLTDQMEQVGCKPG